MLNLTSSTTLISYLFSAVLFAPGTVLYVMARRGLTPVVVSRAVDDIATPTAALIPWNSCGAYMAATLGVATWNYAPFAIFGIELATITVIVADLGFRMPGIEPATA